MAHHTQSEGHEEHTGHGGHHVFDRATLLKTFYILVGLTILTVVLAIFERGFGDFFGFEFETPFRLPFGALSVPIALAIAGTKVYWVASRFMGLKYEHTQTNLLVFLGSTSFLLIFFGITYLDFGFRSTFEELSAVPTDIFEEEQLEAREALTGIEAPPLVGQPDPGLFGTPVEAAPAGSAPVDAIPQEPVAEPVPTE